MISKLRRERVKNSYCTAEILRLTSRSQTLGGQWLVSWRCRSLEDPRLLMRMVGRSSILFLRNLDHYYRQISDIKYVSTYQRGACREELHTTPYTGFASG